MEEKLLKLFQDFYNEFKILRMMTSFRMMLALRTNGSFKNDMLGFKDEMVALRMIC